MNQGFEVKDPLLPEDSSTASSSSSFYRSAHSSQEKRLSSARSFHSVFGELSSPVSEWQSFDFPPSQYPPADNGQTTPRPGAATPVGCPPRGAVLQSKYLQYRMSWLLASWTVILTVFSIWYAYTVLVSENPVPALLNDSPGRTAAVVQIVDHTVAFLIWRLFASAFEALRWALASRSKGVRLTTFLALSRATPMTGVISLLSLLGSHWIWCAQRLSFAALTTFLSLVLRNNIVYKNMYTSAPVGGVGVVAGLASLSATIGPIGRALGGPLSMAAVNFFFMAFAYGFISDPNFVIAVAPLTCSGANCTSIFLPGGLDLVRRVSGGPHATLFDGPTFSESEAILIHDAPGMQVEFSPIENGFAFNSTMDCTLYGRTTGQGLYFCIAANDTKVLAGWSVCPTRLYTTKSCFNDTSWTDKPDESTSMTIAKRYATVAYDTKSFSILSIESITKPTFFTAAETLLLATDLRWTYLQVLSSLPTVLNTTSGSFPDYATSYSTQYDMGWALRLFQDDYESYTHGPLNLLQNFLTIPVQFATTALQFVDFYSLPADMHTTATVAKVSYRARAQMWAWCVYSVLSVALIGWAVGILAWSCRLPRPSPNTSQFPELDVVAKCISGGQERAQTSGGGQDDADQRDVPSLAQLIRRARAGNSESGRLKHLIKDVNVYVGALQDEEAGGEDVEQPVVIATEEGRLVGLVRGTRYS